MDNKLELALQREFDRFERKQTVVAEKNSEWEYDAYMDQPSEGLLLQERVTYRRRKDGKIERECVTRTFYGKNDYQDSSSTTII